jgi:hypothetical protein
MGDKCDNCLIKNSHLVWYSFCGIFSMYAYNFVYNYAKQISVTVSWHFAWCASKLYSTASVRKPIIAFILWYKR